MLTPKRTLSVSLNHIYPSNSGVDVSFKVTAMRAVCSVPLFTLFIYWGHVKTKLGSPAGFLSSNKSILDLVIAEEGCFWTPLLVYSLLFNVSWFSMALGAFLSIEDFSLCLGQNAQGCWDMTATHKVFRRVVLFKCFVWEMNTVAKKKKDVNDITSI